MPYKVHLYFLTGLVGSLGTPGGKNGPFGQEIAGFGGIGVVIVFPISTLKV